MTPAKLGWVLREQEEGENVSQRSLTIELWHLEDN